MIDLLVEPAHALLVHQSRIGSSSDTGLEAILDRGESVVVASTSAVEELQAGSGDRIESVPGSEGVTSSRINWRLACGIQKRSERLRQPAFSRFGRIARRLAVIQGLEIVGIATTASITEGFTTSRLLVEKIPRDQGATHPDLLGQRARILMVNMDRVGTVAAQDHSVRCHRSRPRQGSRDQLRIRLEMAGQLALIQSLEIVAVATAPSIDELFALVSRGVEEPSGESRSTQSRIRLEIAYPSGLSLTFQIGWTRVNAGFQTDEVVGVATASTKDEGSADPSLWIKVESWHVGETGSRILGQLAVRSRSHGLFRSSPRSMTSTLHALLDAGVQGLESVGCPVTSAVEKLPA